MAGLLINASTSSDGQLVQTKFATDNTHFTWAPGGNTFSEITTDLRVTVSADTASKLLMTCSIPVSGGGTTATWCFGFYNVTAGGWVEPNGLTGSLSGSGANHEVHFAHRGSHQDANDQDVLSGTLVADVINSSANIYTIRGQCQTAQTFYVNHSVTATSTYSFTGTSSFIIQEVKV